LLKYVKLKINKFQNLNERFHWSLKCFDFITNKKWTQTSIWNLKKCKTKRFGGKSHNDLWWRTLLKKPKQKKIEIFFIIAFQNRVTGATWMSVFRFFVFFKSNEKTKTMIVDVSDCLVILVLEEKWKKWQKKHFVYLFNIFSWPKQLFFIKPHQKNVTKLTTVKSWIVLKKNMLTLFIK
jgi:hypothetical protein